MNKLSLNVKKTKGMSFHMPQKRIITPKIKINGTIIEFVHNFNFLGINLNKHLNWNQHVKIVSNKLVKTVGVLNILKKTLPLNLFRIIYNTLILPHLNYGILAWGHQAKRLNLIQKRAVRILTASKYNSHTEPLLLKQTNILKVSDICTLNEIKFIFTNSLTSNYRNILIISHMRQTLIFTDITLVGRTNYMYPKLTMILPKTI